MNRRSLLAGACLVAVILFIFAPATSGEDTHPCVEVYARCAFMALTSGLSLGKTAEWLNTCSAMYVSCLVAFHMPFSML